ncbi:Hypothetical protein AT6N2_L1333 [Agrobacterium tumefaciens]|uniref:DUF2827 family protein n=1 Tax=Agrobacterium tumefaciens TaxID=358 RepID=UPI001ADD2446|nr:Hypothetical protein AT6N2_L1333 [Agrobacterium tumefaciens]
MLLTPRPSRRPRSSPTCAERLLSALRHHDALWGDYLDTQQRHIWRFHAENPHLIQQYDDLLFELLSLHP